MTDKLTVYNDALIHLEDRRLASLSEARESRRVLDDLWDGALAYCLASGEWNFAMRSVQADSSASITPTFGYQFAFTKPTDWASTFQVSAGETFEIPLKEYEFNDEAGIWYANVDPLYVKYVSNDPAYGGDLSLWTPLYAEFVSARLAVKGCRRITGNTSLLEGLIKLEDKAKKAAQSRDARDETPISPPRGSWVTSRLGAYPATWSRR